MVVDLWVCQLEQVAEKRTTDARLGRGLRALRRCYSAAVNSGRLVFVNQRVGWERGSVYLYDLLRIYLLSVELLTFPYLPNSPRRMIGESWVEQVAAWFG